MEDLVSEGKCKAIGLSDITLAGANDRQSREGLSPRSSTSSPNLYLPEWELLNYCKEQVIVLQAFAALGHSSEPSLLKDSVIIAIAQRVGQNPGSGAAGEGHQRGTAPLTTSKTPSRIQENFQISTLPDDAVREISDGITSRIRFNAVVETGVPGFIPRGKGG